MISVALTTFNGEAFIEAQIRSILSQLGPGDEVIVSDDGSSDRTLEILKNLGDPRVQIYHSDARNLVRNFQNALTKTSGDFIFLSDQDDVWKPGKVEKCLKALEDGAGLVVSDCTLIDQKGAVIADSYYALKPPRQGLVANLYKNSFIGCCMAFRRSVLKSALPFPSTIAMHDWWIGSVALATGEPVVFLTDKLVLYRRHGKALSTTGFQSTLPWSRRFADRANLASRVALRRLGLA